MINQDYIQELLIKPTPDDLKIYKRMGLDEYTSPTGARYPTQDYFSPPKRSSINRDFVGSLAAGEHEDVQESKLPPMADPDQPLDFFADPVPPAGIPDIVDPTGLTGDIKPPVREDAVRAIKQLKGLARGAENVIGTVGSMAQWVAERATIGNILTKHTDLPYGAGVVAEYLVRKFGPKKPMEFFDKQMTKYAKQGEKWADYWEEQSQKGWEAPDPEVTQAKWRDMPITKGVATISEAAPNYLAAIAISVLTKSPQTGLLFISALSGAGAYRRQRKAGAGVAKANAIATLTGAWEYITEKVPFDEVFKPAKSTFLKMLKLGTLESAQEFVQGIGENFLEYFGYKAKDLNSVPAAVKEGLEHTMDGWVENVVAGAGLGVIGGGIVPKGSLIKAPEPPPKEAIPAPDIAQEQLLAEKGVELPPKPEIELLEPPTVAKAEGRLPTHLQAIADKAKDIDKKRGFTIEDVTPEGFGPAEGVEPVHPVHLTTEQQRLVNTINEAKTLLKGKISGEKRTAIERDLAKAEKKLEALVQPVTKAEPATEIEKFGVKALQQSDSLKGITDKEALAIIRAEKTDAQEEAVKDILRNRGIDVDKIDIPQYDIRGALRGEEEARPTIRGKKPSHQEAINLAVEEAMQDVTFVIDVQMPEYAKAQPVAKEAEPVAKITSGYPPKEFEFTGRWSMQEQGYYRAERNKQRIKVPIYKSADGEEFLYMEGAIKAPKAQPPTVAKAEAVEVAPEVLAKEARKYKSADEFVGGLEKQGKIYYHGTDKKFIKFSPKNAISKTSGRFEGGYHFGTREQAKRKGDKIQILAHLDIKNTKRVKDSGGSWKSQIESAKKEGYDSIVYLNRFEGISITDYEKAEAKGIKTDIDSLEKMTDLQFQKNIPSATDSYIAFYPEQIKTKSQLTEIWKQAQPVAKEAELTKPEELAKRLGVPIKIIPKGLRAKAQYRARTDDIAIRSHLPKGFDKDAAIAHELGHRAHTKIGNDDMDVFNKLVEEFRQDINKNVGRNITYFEEKGNYHGYFEAFAELYGRYFLGKELPNNQFKFYFDEVSPIPKGVVKPILKAEQVKPKAEKEKKRVISEKSYQAAKKRLTDPTKLRMGVEPQGFADLVTIGAYHVENGLRTFATWSKKMIEIYGESVKPHLQKIWNQVKPLNAEEVEAFPKEFLTGEQRTKAEMGEIPSEGEYKSQSEVFNEHLDYFQKRQLPKTSRIPKIQAMIRTINGQRLAGKVSAKAANKAIIALREQLIETAIDEGIALRMTRGGKVSLSVRKAGTFVPEEFAQYGKFKNIRPILGGGQDITRAIQQMDGSLSVKGKLRAKGQAGPLERHVLWPTRDISLQKLKYIKEKTAELKSIFKTKKGSKEDEQVNLILEQIAKEDRTTPIKDILSRKTLRAIASSKVIQQAIGLREYYDNLIDEQNLAREMRNQDTIPYRHNYSPHILRDTTIWERLMMTGKKPKDIKADLPDYIKPNAPFNPRAMAREAGIEYEERVKSAQRLAESYLVTATKDIFNTSIVQNNKAFIQQLEAMGYDKSANYLADWTAEAYAGVKPRLDRAIQIGRKAEKSARYFNRLRNMAVFPLNFSWSLLTQTSSLALTVGRYGTSNTLRGFVQWLNPKIRKQAAEDYYSYVVKAEKQGRITRQDAQNLIGQRVKLRRTSTEIARDISTLLLDQLEKLLTGTSIRAAQLHGQKRGLTGEALKNYASDGGAKTQSMYNDEDKPALLRNLLVKTGAPYQTFSYEVVNTMREWAGRTGTPPDTKLYTIWTIVRFLAAASVFAAIGKKWGNKEIWSWKRPPIPFAEFWLNPIVKMFSNQWIGSASGLTSPVETATRVAKGIEDVLDTGSWRKLRNELTKYGPGIFGVPGGVQISRTVDAIIAYAQGGVKDRKGRLLFEMEDPQDLVQAIFSGVWSTEGGRAYLDIDYKIKNMSDKELRQYRNDNIYSKTKVVRLKDGTKVKQKKDQPHKGREKLVEKIDKELEKRE